MKQKSFILAVSVKLKLFTVITVLLAINGVGLADEGGTFPSNAWANLLPENQSVRRVANLQFSAAEIEEERPGLKTLTFSISSRPGFEVQPYKVRIHAYVYEMLETGEIALTEPKLASSWPSLPINWANGEEETVEFSYPLPDENAAKGTASGSMAPKFHGCVVALYYDGNLAATYSMPKELRSQFPPPLRENSP